MVWHISEFVLAAAAKLAVVDIGAYSSSQGLAQDSEQEQQKKSYQMETATSPT